MVGAGLGLSMQTIVIALQNSVEFKDMGVATSSNTFFRSLGSVFGTALFGAILSSRLGHYLIVGREELVASNPSVALSFSEGDIEKIKQNTAVIAQLPPEAQSTALNAFVNSFHVVLLQLWRLALSWRSSSAKHHCAQAKITQQRAKSLQEKHSVNSEVHI
jgi:hypothetical protein